MTFSSSFPYRAPFLALVALFVAAARSLAWLPGTSQPTAVDGFVVDPTNRTDVLAFYHTIYAASEHYAANMAWTGSVANGVPGTTSAAFKNDVRRRINFYRALSALPADIVFDATKSSKDQEAALMFARNGGLSHNPPVGWSLRTPNAVEAAGASNISLGVYGPPAIDGFMRDDGGGNEIVGHRRWFHYSRALSMGTGDVPSEGSYYAANAVWVIGNPKAAPAPQFVAWPNRGFVPLGLVPARWSLSYPGANFANATVTMTQGATSVGTAVISRTDNGYGDNTIVWTPATLPASISADTPFAVTVAGISGSGVPTSHSYTVTIFDPNVLGNAVSVVGSNTPATTGANYTFNSIAQADSYELRVATGSTAAWTEGAEDAPAPQIAPATTGSLVLRQNALVRTSSKAFQLAFPDFNDQSFAITRDLIPAASSELRFYDRTRFSVATNTLSAEISTNNGDSWTSLWSRNGVGLSSANFDGNWIGRNVSLAAYAGQIVRVRFILRSNGGSVSIGTGVNHGFFIDDVTVTGATELVGATTTALAGAATSFTLNAATAGAPLVAGTAYFLRVRPNVGTCWFSYGATKTVTAQAASGYASWIAANFPAVTGGPTADHEGDGIANGVEWAFGLNPTAATSDAAVPQPTRVGNAYAVTFTQPASVTSGVTYGAQWSRNLVDWFTVADSGSGATHTFTVNTSNEPRVFFRHRLTFAQ